MAAPSGIANTCSYRIKEDIISQDLEGEEVILDLSRKVYYGLDPVGTKIWHGLRDGSSIESIKGMLVRKFDVTEKILEQDLEKFLKELIQNKLIEPAA